MLRPCTCATERGVWRHALFAADGPDCVAGGAERFYEIDPALRATISSQEFRAAISSLARAANAPIIVGDIAVDADPQVKRGYDEYNSADFIASGRQVCGTLRQDASGAIRRICSIQEAVLLCREPAAGRGLIRPRKAQDGVSHRRTHLWRLYLLRVGLCATRCASMPGWARMCW